MDMRDVVALIDAAKAKSIEDRPRPSFRYLTPPPRGRHEPRDASARVSAGGRLARAVGVRHQSHRFRAAGAELGQRQIRQPVGIAFP
jgi:hypothetical protein